MGRHESTFVRLGFCFFVRHAYSLGASYPYRALKTTLKAEVDLDAWASLRKPRVCEGTLASTAVAVTVAVSEA
jgi:hypothetical protein